MSSSWVLASSFASVSSIDFLSLSLFFFFFFFFLIVIFIYYIFLLFFFFYFQVKRNAIHFAGVALLFFSFFFCIFLHLVLFSSFNPPRAGVVVPGRFVSRVSRLRSRPRDQSRTPNRLKGEKGGERRKIK